MNKVLILFAHPALEKSRVHSVILKDISNIEGVTVNDLYQIYPEFDIDIKREQQLLLSHDIIVWQHPFYWYSAPAILKQWQDLVLEHGWAYGRNGDKLRGKVVFNMITAGSGMETYQPMGRQHCTVQELMRPFERTADLCSMKYLQPFWIPGSHKLGADQITNFSRQYKQVLIALRDGVFTEEEITSVTFLNELAGLNKPVF